jgi:RNA polymerase sigma-70 factor (ECF subfamily)
MDGDSNETNRLLERAAGGDRRALETLLAQHRERLRRMIAVRLDPRLRQRIDPSDVIQETYMEASTRLESYLNAPTMPFFLWLRFLTGQKVVTLHRRHLGARMRDAGQEEAIHPGAGPEASSAPLADLFLDQGSRPSEAAIRAETKERVRAALEKMAPIDREVLALRHFEQLSRAEIAGVLGVSEAAAGKRYLRALEKLKQILGPAGGSES